MKKSPQALLRRVSQHRPAHWPGRRVAAGLFPWAVARPYVHRHAGQRVPLPVPLVPPAAPEVPEPIVPVPVVPVVPDVAPELLLPEDVLSVPEPVVPAPLPVVPEAPMLPEPVAPPVVDELLPVPVPEPMPDGAGLVELPGARVPEGVSLRLQALSPATPTNKAVTIKGRHELVFIKFLQDVLKIRHPVETPA